MSERARPAILIAAVLALAFISAPAHARTMYDVEIIVFENLDVPADNSERWQPEVTLPLFDRTAAFEPDDPVGGRFVDELPEQFGRLTEDEYRLRSQRKRLDDSRRYRVLRHEAWRQPAFEADEAVSLRIREGEPIAVDIPIRTIGPYGDAMHIDEILRQAAGDAEQSAGGYDDADWRSIGPMSERRRVRVYPLDGTVRIVVRRYLHVHTNLYFTTPVTWAGQAGDFIQADGVIDDANGNGGQDDETAVAGSARATEVALGPDGEPMLSYPFRQQRRMRSGELHYLDNPVIGMLVLVTPRDGE